MNVRRLFNSLIKSLWLMALASSPTATPAGDLLINPFDTVSETNQWRYWWGLPSPFDWSGADDANGKTNSGALRFAIGFTNGTGWQMSSIVRDIVPPVDGAAFISLAFDVRVDPSSHLTSGGYDYGGFAVFLADTNWNTGSMGEFPLIGTAWEHVEISLIYPTTSNIVIRALGFQAGAGTYAGPVTLWLDNVTLVATPLPPAIAIQPAGPGVEFYASVPVISNAFYQRQCIRTMTGDYSWVGKSQPVTYAISVSDFPAPGHSPPTAYLMLVGNSPNPGGVPDWYEASVIAMYLQYWGTNTGIQVRYKLNAPNSNIIWTNATIIGNAITNALVGTFGMALQATNISIFWPGGGSPFAQFPATGILDCFNSSTHVYVGIMGGGYSGISQSATINRVAISGLTLPFDETFPNLNNWNTNVAQDPYGIVLHPSTTIAKLCWPVAPAGFRLYQSPDVSLTSWATSSLPSVTVCGRKIAFPTPGSPGTRTFYRLQNP